MTAPCACRIALVYPFPNLDSVPSLTQAVELLAAAGYGVDVFTRRSPEFAPPSFDEAAVEIHYELPRAERRGVGRWLPGRVWRPLRVFLRHLSRPYLCALAVDPQGLVRARRHFRLARVPIAYWSLELLLVDESSSRRQRAWKELEREMLARAPFAVIQDPARAELLVESSGVDPERIVLVPNAPLGPARRRRSGYWHRRFGLPEDERVVLHAGSLDPWTGIEGIVASTSGWPPGFTLVVHTRFAAGGSETVERLRALGDAERIRFSLDPVPRSEYPDLVDGADLGVAFYDPASETADGAAEENLRTIGLSSGKIAYYLRAGLPLVVNAASSVGDLVAEERCGVVVDDAAEIGRALEALGDELERYRRRALETFERRLDFARAFEGVLEHLGKLGG